MNMESYFLACKKLGKKQFVTYGHSCTTGIKTIDGFISSTLYEIPNNNYTEKLIKLKTQLNVGFFYEVKKRKTFISILL